MAADLIWHEAAPPAESHWEPEPAPAYSRWRLLWREACDLQREEEKRGGE